jgi:hypothetical protein
MRKHNFSHTVVEHHEDGSHTVHHVHKKHNFAGPEKRDGDVKGAAMDHDGMMDHVMDHTSQMNPGEGNNEANEAMQAAPGGASQGAGAGAAGV